MDIFALLVTSQHYVILFGVWTQDVDTEQSQGHSTNGAVFLVEHVIVVT